MKIFPLILAAFLLLTGCAHVAPRAITLPTTAAVRAPLVVAQTHAARAVAIGKREQAIASVAVAKGIAAGGAQANELSKLIGEDNAAKAAVQNQLTAALYQAGALDREQARKQAQIDALERDDATKTARVATLTTSRERWQWAVLLLFISDFFAGGYIQSGLRWLAGAAVRIVFALGKHLIAFWPLALAAI